MKNIFLEYSKIIGYTITGLVFGLSFFLLFLNLYHYREVNSTFIKESTDYDYNKNMISKLDEIKKNISTFDVNTYYGPESASSLVTVQSKINMCITEINTNEFKKILDNKKVNIKDVYNMQQFYQINISNECLVKQLYDLTDSATNNLDISTLSVVAPFIDDNITELIKSTDYVQKVIKNNSSYYFNSNNSKINIFDQTKDSYYEILTNYNDAIDFIYDVSVWFRNTVGG